MTTTLNIRVTYTSIDRCRKSATFKTLKGAQAFAERYVGPTPELGSYYAVSADGIGKIECRGAAIRDLFPALAADLQAEEIERSNLDAMRDAWRDYDR